MTGVVPWARETSKVRSGRGPSAAPILASEAHAATAPAQRRAFFGELHLHTGYSFDAWSLMSVKTTPMDTAVSRMAVVRPTVSSPIRAR